MKQILRPAFSAVKQKIAKTQRKFIRANSLDHAHAEAHKIHWPKNKAAADGPATAGRLNQIKNYKDVQNMPHSILNVKQDVAVVVSLNAPRRSDRYVWRDQVIATKSLGSSAVLVAYALTDYFNEGRGNVAWPSHEALSERTHLTSRTVRSALAELERSGLIENERPGGGKHRDDAGILRARTGLYRMVTRK